MTTTVTGLFDNYDDAASAVSTLEQQGVASSDISIVANRGADDATAIAEDAGSGAGLGAAVGGVGGLLAGLGMIAIPGVGPVIAAGWLAATAVGAVAGAAVGGAAGGIVGAMTQAGVSPEDANVYAEGIRRGGTLVTAKVDDALAHTARSIIDDAQSVDILQRRTDYQAEGWERFDENAPLNPTRDDRNNVPPMI